MTDQVKSFPNQNFGELDGKLFTRFPGSQTARKSQLQDMQGDIRETNWIRMGCELRVGMPGATMGHTTLRLQDEGGRGRRLPCRQMKRLSPYPTVIRQEQVAWERLTRDGTEGIQIPAGQQWNSEGLAYYWHIIGKLK